MVRELPPKKCSFNLDFVHKGEGGGVPKQTKSFETLFLNQFFLEFLVERGGCSANLEVLGQNIG